MAVMAAAALEFSLDAIGRDLHFLYRVGQNLRGGHTPVRIVHGRAVQHDVGGVRAIALLPEGDRG